MSAHPLVTVHVNQDLSYFLFKNIINNIFTFQELLFLKCVLFVGSLIWIKLILTVESDLSLVSPAPAPAPEQDSSTITRLFLGSRFSAPNDETSHLQRRVSEVTLTTSTSTNKIPERELFDVLYRECSLVLWQRLHGFTYMPTRKGWCPGSWSWNRAFEHGWIKNPLMGTLLHDHSLDPFVFSPLLVPFMGFFGTPCRKKSKVSFGKLVKFSLSLEMNTEITPNLILIKEF